MSKRKGTEAATSKMTASLAKDSKQLGQQSESLLDVEELRETIKQAVSPLLAEAEQRIILQLGGKIETLEQQISGINKRMVQLKKEAKLIEEEAGAVQTEVKLIKAGCQDLQTSHLRLLFEKSLYRLRIQGFPEIEDERIDERIIEWLRKATKFSEQILQRAIDVIFRVQSKQAGKDGKSREVMVRFLSRGVRDKIYKMLAHNDNFLAEQRILILKDIPYEIWKRRLPYKDLTSFLLSHQVKYRWLIPVGLAFLFKEKPHHISSVAEMQQFLLQHDKSFGDSKVQEGKKPKLTKKK